MMHYSFRRYGLIAVAVVLFLLSMCGLERGSGSLGFAHYCGVLYQPTYFLCLYLPLFLLGVLTLLDGYLLPERVVRFLNRGDAVRAVEKRLLRYGFFYSGSFLLGNGMVLLLFCPGTDIGETVYLRILVTGFVMQAVGWTLIGILCFVLLLYCGNGVLSYFGSMLAVMAVITICQRGGSDVDAAGNPLFATFFPSYAYETARDALLEKISVMHLLQDGVRLLFCLAVAGLLLWAAVYRVKHMDLLERRRV